jgi:hypothetical protein
MSSSPVETPNKSRVFGDLGSRQLYEFTAAQLSFDPALLIDSDSLSLGRANWPPCSKSFNEAETVGVFSSFSSFRKVMPILRRYIRPPGQRQHAFLLEARAIAVEFSTAFSSVTIIPKSIESLLTFTTLFFFAVALKSRIGC